MKARQFKQWIVQRKNYPNVKLKRPHKTAKKVFLKFKKKLQKIIGKQKILWLGSEPLGLLGKGEFDIYVVVNPKLFRKCFEKLNKTFTFGRSEKGRSRFNTNFYRNEMEIQLCTQEWLKRSKNLVFFNKLKKSEKLQKEYEKIKKNNTENKYAYLTVKNAFIERVIKQ